jgi:MSHA biogenesis protein MshK
MRRGKNIRTCGLSLWIAGGIIVLLPVAEAGAQVDDPTRPPHALQFPGDEGGSALQSVLISDNRRAAIIGGQLVELGQKYGEATLVRVSESEVTLVKGRETQVLRLFPGIEKTELTAQPAPAAPARPHKKSKSQGSK